MSLEQDQEQVSVGSADGANVTAVKPASTPVAATDPALAVGLSPNSPLPAGTNVIGALSANQSINVAQVAGAAPSLSNPLPVELSDGTNLLGTSGHPVRTDPTGTTNQPVSGTVTANQGTPNSLANAWPTEITDGTTGPVAVKPASTATVATDKAFVVGLSPNSNQVQGVAAEGAALSGSPVRIGGSDATDIRTFATDANGVIINAPLSYAIAIGRLTGSAGRIAGDTTIAVTNTETPVRNTVYTAQTSNAQRSINSTSGADTSAGTGARTVLITYYSISAGVVTGPFTETVTLNGNTAVNTVSTTVAFIESVDVLTGGVGNIPTGTLQVFSAAAGGGSVFASIPAQARRTAYCHHYVASLRKCYITDLMTSSTAASAQVPNFHVRSLDLSTTNAVERRVMDNIIQQGDADSMFWSHVTPIVVQGPALITGYVTTTNSVSQVNAMEFGYFEV